jgi:hypothetical protein
LTRSRQDLLVENAILRPQLIVLKRSVKRPQFTNGDRTRPTLLARLTNFWQSALFLVQPDTLLCGIATSSHSIRNGNRHPKAANRASRERPSNSSSRWLARIPPGSQEDTWQTTQVGDCGGQTHH